MSTGIFIQLCILVPHTLLAATQMNPPAYDGPKETEIEFVVDDPVAPAGNCQIYEVAPGTIAIQ